MEHNFLPVPFPPNSSSDDDSSLFWWQRTPPPLRVRPPIAPFRKSVSVVRDSTSVARSREIYTQLYEWTKSRVHVKGKSTSSDKWSPKVRFTVTWVDFENPCRIVAKTWQSYSKWNVQIWLIPGLVLEEWVIILGMNSALGHAGVT